MKLKLLLPIFLCFFSISTQAQPEIEFVNTTFDFDTIFQHSDGRVRFEFKNIGDQPLVITRGRTGDGGLGPPIYSREPILPGDSGWITGRYDTRRLGIFRKRFTIHSNSKENERVFLLVKGVVILNKTKIETSILNNVTTNNNNNSITFQQTNNNNQVILKCDLGQVDLGELKTAYFEIKNIGEHTFWLNLPNDSNGKNIPNAFVFMGKNNGFPDFFNSELYFNREQEAFLKRPSYFRSNEKWELDRKILKDETGFLKFLFFNHHGKIGKFKEIIPLKTNTEKQYQLEISGEFINSSSEKAVTFEYSENNFIKKYFQQGQVKKIEFYHGKTKVREQIFSLEKF